jgi:hypothetical protein
LVMALTERDQASPRASSVVTISVSSAAAASPRSRRSVVELPSAGVDDDSVPESECGL